MSSYLIESAYITLLRFLFFSRIAFSSLSYAFSLFKLSEEKAASMMAETCREMPERTASNQKLLFFGNYILKSPGAKSKLQPIRDMLTESYRDDVGVSGEEILEKSQQ